MNRHRLLGFVTALGGGAILAFLLLYLVLFRDLPDPAGSARTTTGSTIITDRNGRLLYEIIDPEGSKHVPLELSEVPLLCRQATVATEDARFFSHPGVDMVAIVRAALQNRRAGGIVSGGSTLTQQLARNLLMTEEERLEQSLQRKLREAWLALRLERSYTKDELLALYLNTTYYGHFAVGMEAAAQAYFGVHASELDLAQCALLAGLPQSPIAYNPIENPAAAERRQAAVLALMVQHGYLPQAAADDAELEALSFAATPFPIAAPHFVMWVQGQVETLLSPERLREGGLRIETTLDLDWQRVAEESLRRRLAQLRPCLAVPGANPRISCDPEADPSRRVENGALVALEPGTGAVLTLVGSPDYFDATISGALNAALSFRQPGSAIKPLTYAAVLDPNLARAQGRRPWTAATLIADLRTTFMTFEDTPYVPNNYDLTYHGPVTVRTALANSYNIPAVKALDTIGVDTLVGLAGAAGIPWNIQPRSIGTETATHADQPVSRPRYGLALTLGGGEVRLLDLTAVYAVLANGGYAVKPYGIKRIETFDGEVLFAAGTERQGTQASSEGQAHTPILDPRAAFLVTDILSDNNARLPAFGQGNMLEIDRPAAVKTGTTSDWRDNWTVGYTPDLVTGVWVGNVDNSPMKDVSGISGAAPIWHDFMLAVLRDRKHADFPTPDGLVQVEVCADSGLLPGNGGGSYRTTAGAGEADWETVTCPLRRLEWFIEGTEPDRTDESHVRLTIDVRDGSAATDATPQHYRAPSTVWLLPPEYAAWARENNIPQPLSSGSTLASRELPGGTKQPDSAPILRITSPDPNRTYRIDPGLPAASQQIPVTALPGVYTPSSITLLVDGRVYATTHAPDFTTWWRLVPGRHTFQVRIVLPDGEEVNSAPVEIAVQQ